MKDTLKAPSHLAKSTAIWWSEVVAEFELDPHHLRILTLAGESWDRCEQARKIIAREGLTFEDFRGQPKARPEVAIERDSRIAFARLIRELGLDVRGPEDTRPPRVGGKEN